MRYRGYQVRRLCSHCACCLSRHCSSRPSFAVMLSVMLSWKQTLFWTVSQASDAVMCAQVHWLTLGANLVNSSAQLFLQLPQIETIAYQTNITVSRMLQRAVSKLRNAACKAYLILCWRRQMLPVC